jgi:large subunit ribosomal protein L29
LTINILNKMADKKNTLHELTEDALHTELTSLENELRKMSLEHNVRGTADNSLFKKARKNIARVHTELRKRDLAEYSTEDLEMRSRIRARRTRARKA